MKSEQPVEISWEAYAIETCQLIVDASMFWAGTDEEKNPLLKKARTMAGIALEKYNSD